MHSPAAAPDPERGGGGGGRLPRPHRSSTSAAPNGSGGHHYNYHRDPADYHGRARHSWLVPVCVVACVVVFVVTMYVNDCRGHELDGGPLREQQGRCVARFLRRFSFQPLRENPLLGPSSRTLIKMGALERSRIVDGHQGWRLLTATWLHAGLIHLLANMLSLVFIGIRLEQQFGFVRIGIIYLLSGFGGSVLSGLFLRNSISVGASSALFGLLGAMLSELLTNWNLYCNKAAAVTTLLVVILINLAVGIVPHVDNFAHIGGFLVGFLLGFIILLRPQYAWMERDNLPADNRVKSKYKLYQLILLGIATILLIAGLVFCTVMLFKGKDGNDHCSWCHYLSCVPTSKWKCDNS
uniref:RHOMBOID-like protein n=1 Tax=Alisma plantago-aquatica TaxID=15000 RepID=A0A0A7E879_ALIPL|nr:rhomboid protein Alipl7598 [Alisma plantago-aquatica]